MDRSIKAMESKLMKSIKSSKTSPDNTRVDAQARENTLKTMAYELEQKFVFVLGSANKAKKLPHVSTLKNLREPGSQMENSPPLDAACPTSPNPVDVLDILQALSNKIENLRNKIHNIEQIETSTSTTNTTKLVTAILQMQIDIAALFHG